MCLLSLVNGGKGDISETLLVAGILVSWNSNTGDLAMFRHGGTECFLISVEAEVTNEQGIAWWAFAVAEFASAVLGVIVILSSGGEVKVDGTTVNFSTLLLSECLLSIGTSSKINISDTL